ncbi:pentatricopeptide repeat-containing protein At3g26782, mitochondrial-like [Cryptomeria japonica]|uniref:pentatricopeptide repeat-containing protein At3g26782, mitochondrial-like n=1 Tax=Cryptomeria japonica TaxID=3369 RepID=UPI0025AD4B06|nr:pentatricopeptide repeat-containing protein At3g26782, mitochondrial-like [Cryptomeria japonica]
MKGYLKSQACGRSVYELIFVKRKMAIIQSSINHSLRRNQYYPRFNRTISPNIHIREFCRDSRLNEGIHILFSAHNPLINSSRYLLKTGIANNALSEGKRIHLHINNRGFTFAADTFLQNTLINMYDKCGSLADAFKVFDQFTEQDVFSWNMIIAAYRRHGFLQEAFTLFRQMQRTSVQPNQFTFANILPACTKMGALKQGMEIHERIIERGFLTEDVLVTSMVDMYAKCGSIHKARELFDRMRNSNVISWTAMVAGYAQNGVLDEALRLFKQMPQRNVVSWTAIIAGYAQNGPVEKALEIFKQMQFSGVKPNSATFSSILPVCAKMGYLEQGMEIHQKVNESGFLSDVVLVTSLIDIYGKCGRIQKARKLFDKLPLRDAVSWNAIIAGYAQNGPIEMVFNIFKQMQLADVNPNSSTYTSILQVCAKMGNLEQGIGIHQKVIERSFLSDVVLATALIDMYAKCGNIQMACKLFDNIPERNMVSWTAIITGCAQNGLVEKALDLFKQMQLEGIKADSSTFASILPACGKLGVLENGTEIHQKIIEIGFLSDIVVVNSLIDMYAKCGNIQKARQVFDNMHQSNVVSWTAMIAGYAMHGYSMDALKLFELMKHSGTNPNHISFIAVLFACSHAGLVDVGCKYFNEISESCCITPTMDHYACMVDLLGRAGYVKETLNFIIKIPIKPDVVVWMCLLGTCRTQKNIGLGEFVATILFELDPKNTSPYVLLSNMYAEIGRWVDNQKVRKFMKEKSIKKIPGCSWIEVDKMVHAFCVGDRSHPQTHNIYAKLEELSWEMKTAGYIPDTIPILNHVEKEEKELLPCHHSEKLAIAFGLLNTAPGTTIRVFKNLRVCNDCHNATKYISLIVAREIIVRDANRFHHFKHGKCSCGDFW